VGNTYVPWSASPNVRAVMQANRKANSGPELRLRSAIHGLGLRFRAVSRPAGLGMVVDIFFPAAKVAVFVDGCYWHGCPIHGTAPKTNPDYWIPKIERTQRRDALNDEALRLAGWEPVHVWEHESVAEAAERIAATVRARSSLNSQRSLNRLLLNNLTTHEPA
jgi:DNA mismatch endonuclease (patch repair protein)